MIKDKRSLIHRDVIKQFPMVSGTIRLIVPPERFLSDNEIVQSCSAEKEVSVGSLNFSRILSMLFNVACVHSLFAYADLEIIAIPVATAEPCEMLKLLRDSTL